MEIKQRDIVLASNNPSKIKELYELSKQINCNILSQKQFNISSVEETGLTFIENAILKARHAAKHIKLPVIADDSGLEVKALNGQPGIYSSRFSGKDASDTNNNKKLLDMLTNIEDRSARLHCVLVFLLHEKDPTPIFFHGIWEGVISLAPEGKNGFGYDPIFFIPPQGCTVAQLDRQVKNRLSHRAQAMSQLVTYLTAYYHQQSL